MSQALSAENVTIQEAESGRSQIQGLRVLQSQVQDTQPNFPLRRVIVVLFVGFPKASGRTLSKCEVLVQPPV